MNNVGILYICTGKYYIFWKDFFDSCERYFLCGIEKHYFVFTDSKEIKEKSNVHVIKETVKGFPLDSLLRFDMFIKIKNQMDKFTYSFFFNSNMRFVRTVSPIDILPNGKDEKLVALVHPGYYGKNVFNYPYERHKRSTAYVPYDKNAKHYYYMGSLNGGITEDYYRLIETCNENVHKDIDNNVMALYHDESHLNNYLYNRHDVKKISPSFGFPEDGDLSFEPFIIIQDKVKHGGTYFDKLPKKSYGRRSVFFIKRKYWSLKWRLGL